MTARVDIAEFDDTALGAEVRHLQATGHGLIALVDSSEPDRRANTWVDGTRGLYKMECRNGHVWLSALTGPATMRQPLQADCTRCGRLGVFVER